MIVGAGGDDVETRVEESRSQSPETAAKSPFLTSPIPSMRPADISSPIRVKEGIAVAQSSADHVVFEVRDNIGWITLNRPDRGNALLNEMNERLGAIWAGIAADDTVRCVVLTGAGDKHFCTGADVGRIAETGSVGLGNGTFSGTLRMTGRQSEVWKPTVCAINGLVAGGGMHFVADADIVVAVEHAEFVDPHVDVGMVSAVEAIGLTHRLPLGTVLRMALQGRRYRLSAQRAYQLGLVDELVSPPDLLTTAGQIAADIAANSPTAVSLSQRSLWSSLEMPYSQAVEYGYALVQRHWAHPDFVEGARAFAERRAPRWS